MSVEFQRFAEGDLAKLSLSPREWPAFEVVERGLFTNRYELLSRGPGWHLHTGGENPVPGKPVYVYRRGFTEPTICAPSDLGFWAHNPQQPDYDIVAYRVIETKASRKLEAGYIWREEEHKTWVPKPESGFWWKYLGCRLDSKAPNGHAWRAWALEAEKPESPPTPITRSDWQEFLGLPDIPLGLSEWLRGPPPHERIHVIPHEPRDRTLRELQSSLPWTAHYHRDFRASPQTHKDFAHALLHIHKAGGKLAAIIDDAEHKGVAWEDPDKRAEVGKYVADMVICALRMANTCPDGLLDLQRLVEDRLAAKNNQLAEAKADYAEGERSV